MSFTPFTFDEATEICEDFEDLRDTEFAMNGRIYLVEDVLVCPYAEADRQLFIASYLATKEAMGTSDDSADYDVILFVFDVENEADIVHMNIRTYAAEVGVGYSFPVHT